MQRQGVPESASRTVTSSLSSLEVTVALRQQAWVSSWVTMRPLPIALTFTGAAGSSRVTGNFADSPSLAAARQPATSEFDSPGVVGGKRIFPTSLPPIVPPDEAGPPPGPTSAGAAPASGAV